MQTNVEDTMEEKDILFTTVILNFSNNNCIIPN